MQKPPLFALLFVVFLQWHGSSLPGPACALDRVPPWPSVLCFPPDPSNSGLGMKYQLEEHLSPCGKGLRFPEPCARADPR